MRRAGKGVIQLISDAYLTADDDFATAELNLIRRLAETSGRRLDRGLLPFLWQQVRNMTGHTRGYFRDERGPQEPGRRTAPVPGEGAGAVVAQSERVTRR